MKGYDKSASIEPYFVVRFEVFHGGDYKECRLLGYENPVRTPQETYYFSGTVLSRLMLCKI
jgi:hypothetical protein